MNNNIRLVVERVKPSEALLERFPSLQSVYSKNAEIIETLFNNFSESNAWEKNLTLANLDPVVAQEILEFYHQVIEDGRYLSLMNTTPETAAELLAIDVSDAALAVLNDTNKIILAEVLDENFIKNYWIAPLIVGIAIGIGIIIASPQPPPPPVPTPEPPPPPDPGPPDGGRPDPYPEPGDGGGGVGGGGGPEPPPPGGPHGHPPPDPIDPIQDLRYAQRTIYLDRSGRLKL
jgi:hypothetical protein